MHRLTESIRALAGAFLAALALGACAPSEPWRQESYVFGTRVEVLIFGTAQDEARAASAQVLQDFDRLHRQYHAWQESDLTRLNTALAAGRPASVSPELAGLIAQAQLLAHESDYLFDPAIGQLIALWGFQSDSPKAELPRSAAIDSLVKRRPASADLRIDGTTVSSRNPAVALDFGGYLKGVALDRAALTLRAHGIQNALINIGGNILALGSKGGVPLAALDLHDGEAIGTSGDYHRFFEVEGKRYFHLLDPRTGRPAFGTMAVTVLVSPGRDTGARSDALSKPLFIAGKDWPALAKKMNLPTVLRVADDGSLELSPAMKARLSMEATDTRIVVRE